MAEAGEWELPTHSDMFALAFKAFFEGTDAHGQLVPGELKALCADLRAWYQGEPTASLAAVTARIVHLVHVHEVLPAACRTQFLLQLLREVCADNEHTIAATDHQLEIVGNVAFAHPSSARILAAQLENVVVAQADSGTLAPMPGTVELPLAAILGAGPEQVPDGQWDHYCQDALLPAAGVTQAAGWVPWAPVIYDPDHVGTDAYQQELAVKLREVGVVIVVLHPGVFELAWVIGALGRHIPLLVLDNAANERPPQIPDDCYRQWVDAAGVRAHVEEFLARAADHLATQQPDPTLVAAWRVSGIAVRRARLLRRWTPPAGISDSRVEELLSSPAAFARARAWELDALTTSLGITPIRWGGMWAPDVTAATAAADTPPATASDEDVEMPGADAIDGADHPVPARPAPALLEEPNSEPERPRKGQLAGQMALELDGVEPDERGWALADQSLGAMEVVLAGTGWETTEWLTSEERSAFAQASGSWPEAHRTWMYRWAQARRALEYVMRDERRRVPARMRLVRLTSPLDWTEQLRVQKSRRFR